MSVVGSLIAYGLRQVVGDAATDSTGQIVAALRNYFTDHSKALPNALARANDRAWQAVGLALAGDGLFDRVKDLFRDGDLKGVRDQIKEFLARTPTGLESAGAGVRLKAAEEWQRLRKAQRLTADALPFDELARRTASLERYGDPARLTAGAHRAVADTAAALQQEAPYLAGLLLAAPPDGAPLLAAAFAFFFRREVETNAELAHGLTFDSLRRLSDRQEQGFAQLEVSLGAHTGRVLDRLDGLFDALGDWFASADAKLDDINAKLDRLIDQHDVPTSTSDPLKVSVTNKAELELLQLLREQLRALPPELVAAADWSKLGDVLAAAGRFREADEAHQAAAAAAQAAADRTAEARAQYKRFRAACETGDHGAALAAFCRAAELDPERFTPFDLHRYRPTAVLGVGGFGTVLRADDLYVRVGKERQPQPVAIKCVHDTGCEALLQRDLSETFDEADTLSALDHPGIVKTLNRGFGDPARRKRPYLVMEYFAGHTLQAWMKVKGTLPLGHVLRIARQVAEAVYQAHKLGIYHRDLKPANVMARFDKTTEQWQVKVIDFGLAVKVQAARVSVSVPSGQRAALDRSLAGTLRYAPPEQRNELDAAVGPYSDVYAFGKTCLDLLFATTEPKSFDWDEVPKPYRKRVQDLLERATVDALKRRWPTFEPVLAGLAELLGETAAGASSVPAVEKGRPVVAEPTASAPSSSPPKPAPPAVDDLATIFQRSIQAVNTAHDSARRKVEQDHDYAAAVEILEAVPEHLRDATLLANTRQARDRAALLDKTVRDKVRATRTDGLREEVTELLQYWPHRADLHRLLESLPKGPEKQIVSCLGMKLALIPAGAFLMGSPDDEAKRSYEEGPQHQVTITRPFYLGVYPVTVGEFQAFVQAAGYKTEAEKEGTGAYAWNGKEWKQDPKFNWRNPGWKLADSDPVTCVSWNDAVAFCQWLAKKEGRAYRLPTEAEWEYACRAGTTTPFHFGASASSTQLNCDGNFPYGGAPKGPYLQRTSKVGSYPTNAWGLHDMHGNVWEWCADWYDKDQYRSSDKTDPQGAKSGDARVFRGGSWSHNAEYCRSAYRSWCAPGIRSHRLGMRVCFRLD